MPPTRTQPPRSIHIYPSGDALEPRLLLSLKRLWWLAARPVIIFWTPPTQTSIISTPKESSFSRGALKNLIQISSFNEKTGKKWKRGKKIIILFVYLLNTKVEFIIKYLKLSSSSFNFRKTFRAHKIIWKKPTFKKGSHTK